MDAILDEHQLSIKHGLFCIADQRHEIQMMVSHGYTSGVPVR